MKYKVNNYNKFYYILLINIVRIYLKISKIIYYSLVCIKDYLLLVNFISIRIDLYILKYNLLTFV